MVPLSVTERADRCKGHNRIGGTGVCRQSDGWIFKYFKTNGALLASAVRQLIAGLEKGAVLFHCTAGKDRTGILASCIFTLCGISHEDIVADYEVTYTYNKKGMNRLLRMLDEETRGRMEPLMRSDAESMERLLAFYQEIRLSKYLEAYGLTEEEMETLKHYFLV